MGAPGTDNCGVAQQQREGFHLRIEFWLNGRIALSPATDVKADGHDALHRSIKSLIDV